MYAKREGREVWGEFSGGTEKQSVFLQYKRGEPKTSMRTHVPLHNMEVAMEKRNDQWSFKATFFFVGYKLDPDAVAAQNRSCAALTSSNPFAAK